MILDIERAWSREPGWFNTLDSETKTRLLAWWKVNNEIQAKQV